MSLLKTEDILKIAYLVNTEKPFLNADFRISNADKRKFSHRDNLRPFACPPSRSPLGEAEGAGEAGNLRESALRDTFSVRTI